MLVLYVKVVVCIIFSSGRIFLPTVLLDKLSIVVLLRILLRTKEEHVLAKMGQAMGPLKIVQTA